MPDEPVDASVIDCAVCSRDGEPPWTVVWGRLPPGAESVASMRVTFRRGRKTQPAARLGVLGRHWAGEVAGRFDKVEVSFGGQAEQTESRKVRPWETPPQPRRVLRKATGAAEPVDPLELMKQRWGLAALILQPNSVDLSELPDLRILGS